MAKKALINKQQSSRSSGCAATRAASSAVARASVYKRFMLCRICFRQLAHAGELPGVTKASW